jgi:HD-GYP domain-containing protein (c-di-GMP phosphodiesterase class II)/DNA-binding CsgD family transcriptional regulator
MSGAVGESLHVAEVLGALSLATDLGSGVPFEKGLRTAVVATMLADAVGLDPRLRRATYYAALLRSLGCTATSPEFSSLFDDDVAVQRELKTADFGDSETFAQQLSRFGAWAGSRAATLQDRFVRELPAVGPALGRQGCEVSAALGTQLELPPGTVAALAEVYERWDGRGFPEGRAGERLTIEARVVHVAEQAVMAHFEGGPAAALTEVRRRSGAHLDPDLCAAFERSAEEIDGALGADDMLARAVAVEPPPAARVAGPDLERICRAFGAFADLKGTFLLGHSQHVADLADAAAAPLGLSDAERAELRLAALLHDLGRVGVPSAIWDRPGPLGAADWERVRLHPYWTGRILSRSPALAGIQALAGGHHERLDGSGYPQGARAAELTPAQRLLAAADVFAALTEDRPHRPALASRDAAAELEREAAAGRLDAGCVSALHEAVGLPRPRTAWPCELTTREVEVLRLVARGLTNREIGDSLFVSARTVQHHLASVYDKIGQRTRAGAAVFAIQHALVPAAG